MVGSGLRVVDALLKEDRTALCGPRDVRQAARNASRAGTVLSEVVLVGLKVNRGTAARARRLWDQRVALTATCTHTAHPARAPRHPRRHPPAGIVNSRLHELARF